MDGNYKAYNHVSSINRIDDILALPAGQFEEVNSLPNRDKLTFTNGYYAYCTALFVDIRDSSGLPSIYLRPSLAKVYRAFISEAVAIINSHLFVREVNIVGDCVWAVYNTPNTSDIDTVFGIAAQFTSLESILANRMKKAGFDAPIYFGVGLSYGRALMVKAGYNGSGINDVVYMGDVVNKAAHLASRGGKKGMYGSRAPRVHMDDVFQQNLNDEYRGWTTKVQSYPDIVYSATIHDTEMNDWLKANS